LYREEGVANRRFFLTVGQANALLAAYTATDDGPYRTRLQAVRLYGLGYPVREILTITGCSRTSLMEWCRAYQEQGIAGLQDKRVGGNRAKLSAEQIDDLRRRLRQYTPRMIFGGASSLPDGQGWTLEDLSRAVQAWYDVTYDSQASYRNLFARCGFTYHHESQAFKPPKSAILER
jgi:transposase